ncbi:hypothetical protein FB45DRAFT_1024459 [Roridomyces roridus]|uniref:Uncharacterized protein n=1 Tax=Roridomyces roridus TaxID=1738132 RepID=A0AAD7C101_9AGAR|nr:hypothetical protein FB45DRAFT_1024459 [Roridomyces roridus]
MAITLSHTPTTTISRLTDHGLTCSRPTRPRQPQKQSDEQKALIAKQAREIASLKKELKEKDAELRRQRALVTSAQKVRNELNHFLGDAAKVSEEGSSLSKKRKAETLDDENSKAACAAVVDDPGSESDGVLVKSRRVYVSSEKPKLSSGWFQAPTKLTRPNDSDRSADASSLLRERILTYVN